MSKTKISFKKEILLSITLITLGILTTIISFMMINKIHNLFEFNELIRIIYLIPTGLSMLGVGIILFGIGKFFETLRKIKKPNKMSFNDINKAIYRLKRTHGINFKPTKQEILTEVKNYEKKKK